MGEYRKMHPTIGEMERGISPGTLEPPVFHTDFGAVGAQICYDIEWDDGWQWLRKAGAEIVLWSSAFGGGQALNAIAQLNKYCIVSSTRKSTSMTRRAEASMAGPGCVSDRCSRACLLALSWFFRKPTAMGIIPTSPPTCFS